MTSLRAPSPGGIPRARLWLVASVFMLWGACALFTLHRLQIVRVDDMRARARRQQECIIRVEPRRGMILDRMGRQLAVSTDAYTVYASASQVGEDPGSLAKLARLLGVPRARVARKLRRGGFVLLERRLAPDVADAIRDAGIPGVELVAEAKRFYPQGELAAHVLGFVVPDNPNLREGLEQRYDDVIRGTPGAWLALRDATGRHIRMEARQAPAPGRDIVTSIDEVIQHIAERELAAAVRETGAKGGMVVVLNTPTGEVLALANRPTFNPNQYGKAKPAARRDRVVTDYYEPGSTFKIITAAAAIDEGLVRASEAIDCENGLIRVAGVPIRDHKPFGILSFREVIEESSNVCAIKVGMRLSRAAFYDYVTRFGFGTRTGIDLPGETPGLLRPTNRWSATSQAYMSFGQEIGVSALQVAAAFSAVANGGVWVPPHVVTRVLDPDGRSVKVPDLPAPRRVISESTARTLVDLMEATVWEGTGKKAAVPGYRAAGKTGTAQKYAGGKTYSESQFIASFCGFVPARHPVLTIHVVLDDPSGDHYHGGDVAAPAFSRIAGPALEYLGVPRDPAFDPLGRETAAASSRGGPGATVPAAKVIGARSSASGRKGLGEVVPVAPRRFAAEPPEPSAAAAAHPVPDLTGAPLRDAVVGLARLGMQARVEGHGFVVAQSPEPGTEVEPGATVTLVLARAVKRSGPREGAGR